MSKILYFDLVGGASGDMLLSAFIDLGFKKNSLDNLIRNLGFKSLKIRFRRVQIPHIKINKAIFSFKKNINLSFSEIKSLIINSKLDKKVKKMSLETYFCLRRVEEKIHRARKEDFKFHHLGEPDALIEITSFWQALEELEIKECFCSSFPLSKPAPATLALLKNKKVKLVDWNYESITPTAASLLKDFPQEEPNFILDKIGYGAGNFSNPTNPDFLRIILGKKEDLVREKILKIEVNLDDINPQIFEYLMKLLFKKGALDVYILPVVMKKNRPSFILSVLTKKADLNKIERIVFKHTTTFGIRYSELCRDKLEDRFIEKKTSLGKIRFRQGFLGGKLIKESPEYEDCKKIASRYNIPLLEVYQKIAKENKAA